MRIKICGITSREDAALALQLGAWAIGFIFYPKSPRYIEPRKVRKILDELTAQGLKPQHVVGVFVNSTAQEILDVKATSGIDTIQLHGDETSDFSKSLPGEKIWKAFRLKTVEQLQELPSFEPFVQAFLFDAAVPGQFGGTGHKTDWQLVAGIRSTRPIILSGGLKPDNIGAAAQTVSSAYAFDLSSGVESAPGLKDHDKLKKLFAQKGSDYDAES